MDETSLPALTRALGRSCAGGVGWGGGRGDEAVIGVGSATKERGSDRPSGLRIVRESPGQTSGRHMGRSGPSHGPEIPFPRLARRAGDPGPTRESPARAGRWPTRSGQHPNGRGAAGAVGHQPGRIGKSPRLTTSVRCGGMLSRWTRSRTRFCNEGEGLVRCRGCSASLHRRFGADGPGGPGLILFLFVAKCGPPSDRSSPRKAQARPRSGQPPNDRGAAGAVGHRPGRIGKSPRSTTRVRSGGMLSRGRASTRTGKRRRVQTVSGRCRTPRGSARRARRRGGASRAAPPRGCRGGATRRRGR